MDIDEYFPGKTDDIFQEGWHIDEHNGHYLFFHYLRLSPSYELARKDSKGELSAEEKRKLPKDFKKVQETYALLGDVQNTFYRYWWQKNGYQIFGVQSDYPTVDVISALPDRTKPDIEKIKGEVTSYFREMSTRTNQTASILISIPINNRVKYDLWAVKEYLKLYKNIGNENIKKLKPKISLQGKRLNAQALVRGLGLLMFKMTAPGLENWRLGVYAKLSPSYSSVLDGKAQRQTRDSREAEDRVLMGKITSRSLRKYSNIAENAARGKFPCDTKVETSFFDYQELDKVYVKTKEWEKKEIERLKELTATI
jgi:hypothetical protein